MKHKRHCPQSTRANKPGNWWYCPKCNVTWRRHISKRGRSKGHIEYAKEAQR